MFNVHCFLKFFKLSSINKINEKWIHSVIKIIFIDWIKTFGFRSNSKFCLYFFTFEKLKWTESNARGLLSVEDGSSKRWQKALQTFYFIFNERDVHALGCRHHTAILDGSFPDIRDFWDRYENVQQFLCY